MEISPIDSLSYKFFQEFARYEYCLKATGIRPLKKNAEADWDEYAKQVKHVFDAPTPIEFREAIEYFLEHPPKKQIVRDGILAWDETPLQEKNIAIKIFILIRRLRNNLFHGGKFNGEWFEPERSEALMRHALIILEVCGQTHQKVREAYAGMK